MKKKIIILSLFLLVLVTLTSIIYIDYSNYFNDSIKEDELITLSVTPYAGDSDTELSDGAVVNAIVTGVVNPNIRWSLRWSDPSAAETLDEYDYVSLTISEDSKTVNLTYKQPFNVPLTLTAVLESYNKSVTANIGCFNRFFDVNYIDFNIFMDGDSVGGTEFKGNNICLYNANYNTIFNRNYSLKLLYELIEGDFIGTYDTQNYNYLISIGLSEDLINLLDQTSISYYDGFNKWAEYDQLPIINILDDFIDDFTIENDNTEILNILSNCNNWFTLLIECETLDGKDNVVGTGSCIVEITGMDITDVIESNIELDNNDVIL